MQSRLPLLGSAAICALLALSACRDLQSLRSPPTDQTNRAQLVKPTPVAPMPLDPLKTIARHEEARSDGDGLVQVLLAKGEESTRERAAVALGRIPFPERRAEVTGALCGALKDPSERVRAAVAFALGMRGDPASAAALLEHFDDSSAEVRARIVEAASRVDDPRLRAKILDALRDPDAGVRAEAALAPHRWPVNVEQPSAMTIDAALLAVARTVEAKPSDSNDKAAISDVQQPKTLALDANAEVAWRALFSLSRRKTEAARPEFEAAMTAGDVRARIFAAQGLAGLAAQPKSQALLRQALGDKDWRVVCEAVTALGKHPDDDTPGALAALFEHPSPHVRRVVCEALGKSTSDTASAFAILERGMRDASVNVRAAALAARAALYRPMVSGSAIESPGDPLRAGWTDVELAVNDPDAIVRATAATALALMPPPTSVPMLMRLCGDKDPRVAEAAIESLGKIPSTEVRTKLRELLAHDDNGIRLAALLALRESQVPEDLPFLAQCFSTSHGEIADEIAFNALESAAKIPGAESEELLKQGLSHENAYVRRRARALLTAPSRELPRFVAPPPRASASTELPDFRDDPHPRVEVQTSKGTLVFELFPSEAPLHVDNFLKLARANRYDGLTFHRVVPDFVVQGGDPRGDGNGGSAFGGGSVRAEFTPRKFIRGSLGMPRNDDPDSGGGQIFVTHRETPHLDGRYTLFGQLIEGFDVLDAIEVGDKIVDVRVLTAGS